MSLNISSVQFSSVIQSCPTLATPWITARQASLSITNSRSLLKLMSIKSVMPSSHLILCRPLLLLPPVPPSIRVFSNESTLHMRWPKYWSFTFSISPSNEHPGLISFRMDGWISLQSKGPSESSPTPQFKSINFLVLSFLHSPTLTSIHDHWKNHSLDQMDLLKGCCWMIRHWDSWPLEETNSIGARDEAGSLRVKFLCSKVLLKYKGDRESSWHRHQKGQKEYPPASL